MRKRSISRSIIEPIDNWLESNDLHRKQIPRDASCLFRAVAEQICLSQSFHEKLRNLSMDYMLLYKTYFQAFLEEPLETYVEKMRSPLEWASKVELMALALIFKTDFLVFTDIGSPATNVTGFNFPPKMLFKDQSNHYDIVYPKEKVLTAGFCQSLVYHILYERVFKMPDVNNVVDHMLHDSSSFRKDSVNSDGQENDIYRIVQQVTESFKTPGNNLNNSIEISTPEKGLTPPFPYRVAKALDPNIYRNSEYDTWIAMKREARFGPYDPNGLQIGAKVLIRMNKLSKCSKKEQVFHGHIQYMTENQGPVQVFAEELGERITVPYDCLEKCQTLTTAKSLQESSLFIGSPPTYRMLSTITKKVNLPIPENFNSPARCGKVKKKNPAVHSLPSPIPIPKSNKNNNNNTRGEEGDFSPDWKCENSGAYLSSSGNSSNSTESGDVPKHIYETPPPPPPTLPPQIPAMSYINNNFDNLCIEDRPRGVTSVGIPIDHGPPIYPYQPCCDPYYNGACGSNAVVTCAPYGEMYGLPTMENYCFVPYPYSWPYIYGSNPTGAEYQVIPAAPMENVGEIFNPNCYMG